MPSYLKSSVNKTAGSKAYQLICLCLLGLTAQHVHACQLDTFKTPLALQQQTTSSTASSALNALLFDSPKSGVSLQTLSQQSDCTFNKPAGLLPQSDSLKQALARVLADVEQAQSLNQQRDAVMQINRYINRDAGTGIVTFPRKTSAPRFKDYEINLFDDLLAPHCSNKPSKSCAQAAQTAAQLWLLTGNYRAAANQLNQADKLASHKNNKILQAKWRAYKDDTIKLWPQEVLLNSLAFTPAAKSFTPPPRYKLLALRPALGLSYLSGNDLPADNGGANSSLQPTLNVDLLGIYWWKYRGSSSENSNTTYRASSGRGIAASLIWDGDDTSYGITYHHGPKWSVSVAQGDDNDTVLSLSFQLAFAWLR